jgi:phosphate/sulfate permease
VIWNVTCVMFLLLGGIFTGLSIFVSVVTDRLLEEKRITRGQMVLANMLVALLASGCLTVFAGMLLIRVMS